MFILKKGNEYPDGEEMIIAINAKTKKTVSHKLT